MSLAREHFRWPNIPQLKLGNIQEKSQMFKTACVAKNIWRIINTIASIWFWKYGQIFVSVRYLFFEAHSFPRPTLSEQIMSAEKYRSIFLPHTETIVYICTLKYCKKSGLNYPGYQRFFLHGFRCRSQREKNLWYPG